MAGLRTDNLNPRVGGAIHRDLYRSKDPQAELAKLTGESRKLSLGFLLIFGLLFGLVGFSANGFWSKTPLATLGEEHWPESAHIDDPGLFEFVLSDGSTAPVVHVDHTADPKDDDVRQLADGTHAKVVLVVNRHSVAELYAHAASATVRPVAVRFKSGLELPALDGKRHAWKTARLFGLIPIRYFVVGGAILGVLCLIPPLGRPFYRFWMAAIAHPLSWINTRVILSIFFWAVFVPAGMWLWLRRARSPVGGDPLGRAPRPADQSYWAQRSSRKPTHFRRWF